MHNGILHIVIVVNSAGKRKKSLKGLRESALDDVDTSAKETQMTKRQ